MLNQVTQQKLNIQFIVLKKKRKKNSHGFLSGTKSKLIEAYIINYVLMNGWWRVNLVPVGAPLRVRVVWTWHWYYATDSLKPSLMTQAWFPSADHKTADLKFKVSTIKHSYLWAHMLSSCCPTRRISDWVFFALPHFWMGCLLYLFSLKNPTQLQLRQRTHS